MELFDTKARSTWASVSAAERRGRDAVVGKSYLLVRPKALSKEYLAPSRTMDPYVEIQSPDCIATQTLKAGSCTCYMVDAPASRRLLLHDFGTNNVFSTWIHAWYMAYGLLY